VAWDDSFASNVKARIDAGQEVDGDELSRFLGMVDDAVMAQPRPPAPGTQHPWTDQQAHDVYSRIHRDPSSVTDDDADGFYQWVAAQGQQLHAQRGQVLPPVPAADASAEERHAYLIACQRADVPPDPEVAAAFAEQVQQITAEATRELQDRYPPGLFEPPPKAPSEDAMRQELWQLVERQQQDPNSVDSGDWQQAIGRLNLLAAQTNKAARRDQLPWVLASDNPGDPGVEEGAVEAMTAPAPWIPRQPTETEQTLAELNQLENQATTDLGGDAA
jgi:hypothetical protein